MSSGDYPAEWEADVVLSDGGTVHVRPVRPTDADRLVAFHGRLSHQSVYYRFFSPRPRLSQDDVTRFTTVDYDDRMALVALLGDDLIGIASYDRWPGRREAEVAFTVDDEHQGRGVATVLLEHLAVIARSHGMTRFTAEVLPENRKMLSVFKRAGFQAKSQFADGVVEVGMGILETDEALEAMHEREHIAEARSVARLLAPRTVAVIGAGERRGTVGHEVLRNLISHGFTGAVYPVHPTAHAVASVRAWPSVLDVPDDVDLAVLAVPACEVVKVVEQCARKRVRGLVILAAGFAEVDEAGATAEGELVSIAHRHGMRVLGPASMGVISTVPEVSMHATYAPVTLIPGRVAFSSQSGPLGVALLEQAHRAGVGISHFVALGNKADVSTNDFLQYWEGDEATSVMALHIASFGNPRKFTRLARRVSKTKPIVAVKTGGGDSDRTVDALFRQTGVIPVNEVAQLFDVARVLESQPLPPGDRVVVLSNAHGVQALAEGALVRAGLQMAELAADSRAHLASILREGASVTNPVDLTFAAEPADYDGALRCVLADDAVDLALVIYASAVPTRLQDITDVIIACERGPSDEAGGRERPRCRRPRPARRPRTQRAVVRVPRDRGRHPRPCRRARALEAPARGDRARTSTGSPSTSAGRRRSSPTRSTCAQPAPSCRGQSQPRCSTSSASPSLRPWRSRLSRLRSPRRTSSGTRYALKATGMRRLGRSEAAGVALDLHDDDAVRGTYGRMSRSLGVGMSEALVQTMIDPGLETAVGIRHHATFGPVVTFGLGGAFAEAIDDVATRVTPLTDRDAADLVRSARAWSVLADSIYALDALEDLLLRVGLLADLMPEVIALAMNPVLISTESATAVDLTIRVAPARSDLGDPTRRMLRAPGEAPAPVPR